MSSLFVVLCSLFVVCSCSYHYTLTIAPTPVPAITNQATPEALGNLSKAAEPSPEPFKSSKPMSIAPGDFQATQSQGGSMVNVIINLNLLKPTSVSTDAAASLQGIPGL